MYYLLLFTLSLLWPLFYRPSLKYNYFPFVLQQLFIFFFLYAINFYRPNRCITLTLSSLLFVYTALILLEALIMNFTSMGILKTYKTLSLGGDTLTSLEEAGFSKYLVIVIPGLIVPVCYAGIKLYQLLNNYRLSISHNAVTYAAILLFMIYVLEHLLCRNSTGYFRRMNSPLYIAFFKSNKHSLKFTFKTEDPDPDDKKVTEFCHINKSGKYPNIVFILLESFRQDVISEKLTPNMEHLKRNALWFSNAISSSIYTSLSWNTILMGRPAYTLESDIKSFTGSTAGSLPLRILKYSGYEILFSVSGNFQWKNFLNRINGNAKVVDRYFTSFSKKNIHKRNLFDNRSAEQALQWIKNREQDNPFFLLLQLDSTHWTYYFDSDAKIFDQIPRRDINFFKLNNCDYIQLIFNRYRNGVRHIDNKIGIILNSLRETGQYENTIIVIVSDHGEGFSPGLIGHSTLHKDIKKIPIIIKLPGIQSRSIDTYTSHSNIFPTIFDHLGIEKKIISLLQGRSILRQNDFCPILTFHGSCMEADLQMEEYIVALKVNLKKNSIEFTPLFFKDNSEHIIEYKCNDTAWEKALQKIIDA